MNEYKIEYKTLIKLYTTLEKTDSFDALSFGCKKDLALVYMKSFGYCKQQEIVEEICEVMAPKLPDMIADVLSNNNDDIEPAYEMADEFVKALFAVVSDDISEDMEDYQDRRKPKEKDSLSDQDMRQRTQDLKASFPIQLDW